MSRIAAVQLRGDGGLAGNLEQAGYWIDRAAAEGAALAVLPENFAYFGRRDLAEVALTESFGEAPARRFLAGKARQRGIWLVGGTLPLYAGAEERNRVQQAHLKPFAASLVFNANGVEVARYDKMHLFDVSLPDDPAARGDRSYRESDNYRHGSEPVVVTTPCGTAGLSVCYDLRFPELYRLLVQRGADILLVPSAFTATTGAAHWHALLRARAIENQCYLVGPNLGNRTHGKIPTWGGSVIFDPWGRVIGELDAEPGILVADIDSARLRRLRADMPVLEHRRLAIVKDK